MIILQEAAQRALIRRIEAVQRGETFEVTAVLKDCHKALSALASEPQACRSVSGKCERQGGLSSIHEPQAEPVEQPGAVGLSEYKGVRCACIATKCSAGPGCPLYTANCAAHISHAAQAPRPAWDGTYRDFCPGGSRCLRGCYSNEPCRDEAPKGSVAATQGDAP